ncbi:hypothetical protein [Bacteroides sp.]|nr:hypothetical protein [Bacteroides sp.]MDD3040136.1 hypothetical protein [Bacteroides sp.]
MVIRMLFNDNIRARPVACNVGSFSRFLKDSVTGLGHVFRA